jgi:hypothetical protein
MGIERQKLAVDEGIGETVVSAQVRVEAAERGGILWRNNVGAAVDERGRVIRYGLCNDSKRLNARFKSSDLIGIMPVKITTKHIGSVIGQFLARETKRADWRYKRTAREESQLRFIELVMSLGGNAAFTRGRGSI